MASAQEHRVLCRRLQYPLLDIGRLVLLPFGSKAECQKAKGGGRTRPQRQRLAGKLDGTIGLAVQQPIALDQGIGGPRFDVRTHVGLVGQKLRDAKPAAYFRRSSNKGWRRTPGWCSVSACLFWGMS